MIFTTTNTLYLLTKQYIYIYSSPEHVVSAAPFATLLAARPTLTWLNSNFMLTFPKTRIEIEFVRTSA